MKSQQNWIVGGNEAGLRVGPVHSREVPLPLMRDEIGLTAVVIVTFTAQLHKRVILAKQLKK